jgi:hypothetical protein
VARSNLSLGKSDWPIKISAFGNASSSIATGIGPLSKIVRSPISDKRRRASALKIIPIVRGCGSIKIFSLLIDSPNQTIFHFIALEDQPRPEKETGSDGGAMMFVVDTNILLYGANRDCPEHSACLDFLEVCDSLSQLLANIDRCNKPPEHDDKDDLVAGEWCCFPLLKNVLDGSISVC